MMKLSSGNVRWVSSSQISSISLHGFLKACERLSSQQLSEVRGMLMLIQWPLLLKGGTK